MSDEESLNPSSRSCWTIGAWGVPQCCRGFLLLAVSIDLFLRLVQYTTFPWTSWVRPLLFVLRHKDTRTASVHFVKMILSSKDVLLFFFTFVTLSAVLGVVLFQQPTVDHIRQPPTQVDGWVGDVKFGREAFLTLKTSFVAMLIFLTSGENYEEIVPPMLEVSKWYSFYFVTTSVVGMYIFVALLVATFQASYLDQRLARVRTATLNRRRGILAAFWLLDKAVGTRLVSHRDFKIFLSVWRRLNPIHIETLMEKVDPNRVGVDVKSFVQIVEKVNDIEFSPSSSHVSNQIMQRLRSFKTSLTRETLMLTATVLFAWLYSVDSTSVEHWLMDAAIATTFGILSLDVLLRIVTNGFHGYIFSSEYFERQVNRFDLFLVISSIPLIMVLGWKVAFCVSTFRLFTISKRVRGITVTLWMSLGPYRTIAYLLLTCFMIYARLGTQVFARHPTEFETEWSNEDTSGFRSNVAALLTLYQCFASEGWHRIMFAYFSVNAFAALIYFFSFVFFIGILFGSLFVGILVDFFRELMKDRSRWEHLLRRRRRTGVQRSISEELADEEEMEIWLTEWEKLVSGDPRVEENVFRRLKGSNSTYSL